MKTWKIAKMQKREHKQATQNVGRETMQIAPKRSADRKPDLPKHIEFCMDVQSHHERFNNVR